MSKLITVHADYITHKIKRHYSRVEEEIFCPYCKSDKIYQRRDGGDYYMGETWVCLDCEQGFHEISPAHLQPGEVDQIKDQL